MSRPTAQKTLTLTMSQTQSLKAMATMRLAMICP
jgi:hypothetical protein